MLREILAFLIFLVGASSLQAAVPKLPIATLSEERALQREEQDLAAQLEMARWAKWMFWTSAVSVLVATAGTGGLIYSIVQTRKAIQSAARANEIAENAMLIDTRPWLMVDAIDMLTLKFIRLDGDFVGYTVTGSYTIHNVGKTPARIAQRQAMLSLHSRMQPGAFEGGISVAPGEKVSRDIEIVGSFGGEEVRQRRESRIILHIFLRYKDFRTEEVMNTHWYAYLSHGTQNRQLYAADMNRELFHSEAEEARHVHMT